MTSTEGKGRPLGESGRAGTTIQEKNTAFDLADLELLRLRARRRVAAERDADRWHRWWRREYPAARPLDIARATIAVDRAVEAFRKEAV